MPEWDKAIIVKMFKIKKEDNTKCIIIIATDVYNMDINYLDIYLVIQWDFSMSFDSMI